MTTGDARRGGLVIVGPTASGKSSLALAMARSDASVEVVSADAMALYRGMDIGTAKPSLEERAEVPHHLVDVVEPHEDYTVGRFKDDVDAVLADLATRDRTPVLVGGTGLYVQAVVDDLRIPGQFPDAVAQIESEPDTAALHARLAVLDPVAATRMEPSNRRRIVRALEVCIGSGQPFSSFGPGLEAYPSTPFVLVGLEIDRAVMDQRIDDRYDQQMAAGFLDEVAGIVAGEHGFGRTASQALGYRELAAHLRGEGTLAEAVAEAKRRTHRFARRQQRWFRRDPRIVWFDALAPDLADQVRGHWNQVRDGSCET